MKTLGIIAPITLALAALLAACGGDTDASPGDDATPAASPTAQATRETPTIELSEATPTIAIAAPEPTATPRVQQPGAAPTQPPPPAPTSTPVPQPPVVQPQAITVVAKGTKFNPSQLTASAGSAITVTLDNQDAGIAHDLIVYTPSGATAAQTPAFAGIAQQSATFTPGGAGNYFFKCSLHPIAMNGAIAVQ